MKYSYSKNKKFLEIFILFLTIGLVSFSDIFFISNFGSHGTSYFFVVSAPLLFFLYYLYQKITLIEVLYPVYIFIIILLIYSISGSFLKITALAGIFQFVILPCIFLRIGFFGDRKIVINIIMACLSVCTFFAIGEFLYFTCRINGPLDVFSIIGKMIVQIQNKIIGFPISSRPTGIFINPDTLGIYAGFVFWFCIYCKNFMSKIKKNFCILACLFLILFSFSRGSIVAIIISLFFSVSLNFIFFKSNIKYFNQIILKFFVLIFLIFLSFSFFTSNQIDRIDQIIRVVNFGVSQSPDMKGRSDSWLYIVEKTENMPFGTIAPPQLVVKASADSQFVYFFAQGGFTLFFLLVFLYIYLVYIGITSGRKNELSFFGSVIFLIINSITLTPLSSFTCSIFWIIVGMYARDFRCSVTYASSDSLIVPRQLSNN